MAKRENDEGLSSRPPLSSQPVTTLSPILDSYCGPDYSYGPFDGSVPEDSIGLIPKAKKEK